MTATETVPETGPRALVVDMRGIGRTFDGRPPIVAVRDVDLQIRAGDYMSIVGPSGSGKSTLLHLIGLLDQPSTGTYRLNGIEASVASERDRAHIRSRSIGFVFQAFHLMPYRTVLDNVLVGVAYSDTPRRGMRTAALALLERVGIGHRCDASPPTLSGGERQRVAIARALLGRPSLLLADEPTGNLDSASTEIILQIFDELHADGITIAVITHDEHISARAHRRVRIVEGLLDEQ